MIKIEVFKDIISLHGQGVSLRAIVKKLGIHCNTDISLSKCEKNCVHPHLQVFPYYFEKKKKLSFDSIH